MNRAVNDYIRGEQGNLPNGKRKIILNGGQKEFSSYEEAAQWLIELQGMHDSTVEARVIEKIQNAVKNNSMYCGRKWKEVKK